MQSARTYSDSWHRVADLRPRLRAGVRVTRQRFRGRVWYLFHDPTSTSHHRMSRPAFAFAGLLDGRRTVDDAWQVAAARLPEESPTQDEAITVLSQMHSANLLHADMPGDAHLLLKRRSQIRDRQLRSTLFNILFARIRIADPDAIVSALRPIVAPLFSIPGLMLWALLIALGLTVALVHSATLARETLALVTPANLALAYAASVFGKFFHESAHALACKQMAHKEGAGPMAGVHAVGLAFMFFVPFPYIDASGAWTLRSRTRRALVGAAGIFSDLALASIAIVLWRQTSSDSLAHKFALNLAVISSVSSLLFNANPLMRFDAYYILSDLAGQPNLYQRSRETLLRVLRRSLFAMRDDAPLTTSCRETIALVAYAAAAAVYRVLVLVGITLLIASQSFAIAIPLAFVAIFAFLVVPVARLTAYLAHSPQLTHHPGGRRRAIAVTLIITAALLLPGALVPVPDRVRVAGIVEPANPPDIYAPSPGFIESVADPSTPIAAGAAIVTLTNPQLQADIASLRARVNAATLARRGAIAEDPALAAALAQQHAALSAQLDAALNDADALVIRAESAGVWLPAHAELRPGASVERDQHLGQLIDPAHLRIRVSIPQSRSGIVASSDEQVAVRARGSAALEFTANRSALVMATDPELAPFEVILELPPGTPLRAGQTAVARFTAEPRPLLVQLARSARQALMRAAGAHRPSPDGGAS